LKIKNCKFEGIENFKYLGITLNPLNTELNPICHLLALLGAHLIFHISGLRVNEDNNYQIDLQERIKNANKTCFMLQTFFKNKSISKKLKLRHTTIDGTLTGMQQKPGY
jgi:hypothetical protein